MRIDTGQHLRIDQRMKLAPRMIQSMEILQLSTQALEARIEQELTGNPTLELREPGDEEQDEDTVLAPPPEPVKTDGERELVVTDGAQDKNHSDDFERLNNISEEYGDSWDANNYSTTEFSQRPNRSDDDRDPKLEALANTAARALSLADQLLDQWRMVETTPQIRAAGEYLIGFIDEDGYLRTDRASLLAQAPNGVTDTLLDEALALLQRSLEPVGMAARDLRECLLLQIDARLRLPNPPESPHLIEPKPSSRRPDLTTERLLVSEYLKDIETNHLPRIAERTGLGIDAIKAALFNLRHFQPHPGRSLSAETPRTIVPDAVVEFDETENRYVARLTQDRLPTLQINDRYMKMARDSGVDRRTRDFVQNNLRSARWIIDAIQQRYHTLLRVINVVIEAQRDYFDHGPQHLKPLPMTQVAEQLGIHVATVSRAVSEKYLQTPRGILPLRMFFSGGTETQDGESVSWAAVQAKLQEIIGQENSAQPLSDDDLVEELKKHGLEIARRTVAKYRKQLHIAPARQRKQF